LSDNIRAQQEAARNRRARTRQSRSGKSAYLHIAGTLPRRALRRQARRICWPKRIAAESVDRHWRTSRPGSLSSQIDKQELRKFIQHFLGCCSCLRSRCLLFSNLASREWLPQERTILSINADQFERAASQSAGAKDQPKLYRLGWRGCFDSGLNLPRDATRITRHYNQ